MHRSDYRFLKLSSIDVVAERLQVGNNPDDEDSQWGRLTPDNE
jgi:hypothetical protein